MILTIKNGTKRKILEENERFYYRFAKGALLLRGSCGFDSRREYQNKRTLVVRFFVYERRVSNLVVFSLQKERSTYKKAEHSIS